MIEALVNKSLDYENNKAIIGFINFLKEINSSNLFDLINSF